MKGALLGDTTITAKYWNRQTLRACTHLRHASRHTVYTVHEHKCTRRTNAVHTRRVNPSYSEHSRTRHRRLCLFTGMIIKTTSQQTDRLTLAERETHKRKQTRDTGAHCWLPLGLHYIIIKIYSCAECIYLIYSWGKCILCSATERMTDLKNSEVFYSRKRKTVFS